jgi:hypothetical protein
MKKLFTGLTMIILLSVAAGCSGDGIRKTPVGEFSFGSTSFELTKQGSFFLEHTASGDDNRNFTVEGTYTYTLDTTDEENEITIGKIDVTVTKLTLDGESVMNLDVTVYQKRDIWIGANLPGWWKYLNLVTYGGKMQLRFNSPYVGARPETVDHGSHWLITGDPK